MVSGFYIALENSNDWESSKEFGVFCSRWFFPDATVKRNEVNVVGANGIIDLSSELTGDVAFNNVNGEINFIILKNANFDYSYFKNKYHGKRVKVMPDNDIEHYRVGRLYIRRDNNQDVLKSVQMVLDADPFRYSVDELSYKIAVNTNAKKEAESFSNLTSYASVSKAESVYSVNTNGTYSDRDIRIDGSVYKYLYASINTEVSFSATAKKMYFVSFTVKNKYQERERVAPSLTLNTTPIGSKIGSSKILISDSNSSVIGENEYSVSGVENGETKVSVFITARDSAIKIVLNSELFRVNKAGSPAKIDATDGVFEIVDVFVTELSEEVVLRNNGRKSIVPTLTASVDCELIVNGEFTQLYANEQRKNFDIEVKNGVVNRLVAYGDEDGFVEIKYREAFL